MGRQAIVAGRYLSTGYPQGILPVDKWHCHSGQSLWYDSTKYLGSRHSGQALPLRAGVATQGRRCHSGGALWYCSTIPGRGYVMVLASQIPGSLRSPTPERRLRRLPEGGVGTPAPQISFGSPRQQIHTVLLTQSSIFKLMFTSRRFVNTPPTPMLNPPETHKFPSCKTHPLDGTYTSCYIGRYLPKSIRCV